MNQDSSRSHSIFTITVEASARSTSAGTDGSMHIRVGKLNLVFDQLLPDVGMFWMGGTSRLIVTLDL